MASSFSAPSVPLWAIFSLLLAAAPAALASPGDPRDIRNGLVIPDEGYCDQPYVVITPDGNWLCTLTTGPEHEGQRGQHVVSTVSANHGKTWSPLVDIEPSNGPEASWVVPLVTPGGRVYAFYCYNGDRVDRLPGKDRKIRADIMGWYCFKTSDDQGRTWSDRRVRLPIRVTACDRKNDWEGEVQIFWGIDKPKIAGGIVRFAFTKLGRYMLDDGEGWMVQSRNLLTEPDAQRIDWKLLPDGDQGIRAAPFGSVQEEHNHVAIGPDRLYLVYRTTTGYPCHTVSEDGGHTWSEPEQMTYTPGGRKIENPRACPKLWRCRNGKYLFWFHNHNGKSFADRNPAWLIGGVVRGGAMHWSQPEIVLYSDNPKIRMSYPDLIEQEGRYWITETQKTVARIHEIDSALIEGLWSQGEVKQVPTDGLLLETVERSAPWQASLDMAETGGATLTLWLRLKDLSAGQLLAEMRDAQGRGLSLRTTARGAVRIELSDGQSSAAWDSDAGLLKAGRRHHVVAIVDNGPRIISWVIDGQLCDGGPERQYGWGRYERRLRQIDGSGELRTSPVVEKLRIYGRPLRTSEAVASYHAGVQP